MPATPRAPAAFQRGGSCARGADGCDHQEKRRDQTQGSGDQNYNERIISRDAEQKVYVVEYGNYNTNYLSAIFIPAGPMLNCVPDSWPWFFKNTRVTPRSFFNVMALSPPPIAKVAWLAA